MSIIYNNTEIENITYNNTNIDTVNYNNTEVYVSTRTLTVNKGNYITSIIINGTTYTSNTTLSIKPGTSVTLDCTPNSSNTSGNFAYSYSFSNWTGYTTNSNKSFTFIMPNQDITYIANGTYTQTFNWPSSGDISEDTFLAGINAGSYDTSLVGRYVLFSYYYRSTLSAWRFIIIRVNSDSYDMFSSITIPSESCKYYDIYKTCDSFKTRLSSSVQAKLKTGLQGNHTVTVLSANQLCLISGGDNIDYFNSHSKVRNNKYWTSTTCMTDSYTSSYYFVSTSGDLTRPLRSNLSYYICPAIRVG